MSSRPNASADSIAPDPTRHALPAAAATAAAPAAAPAAARKRRRLWDLPTQAHELLLALSFTPELLRKEVARTLGRMHRGECLLKGGDVDVLYSAVHDMVTRNPLSEALHKKLDERHALGVRHMATLREPAQLQAAWALALQEDDVAASLWALLTHPLGAALEGTALYDTRGWVFAHSRRSVATVQAVAATHAQLLQARQQVDALRARLVGQQQQAEAALLLARAEMARLQGELLRWRLVAEMAAASTHAPSPGPGPGGAQARPRTTQVLRARASCAPSPAPSGASMPTTQINAQINARPPATAEAVAQPVLFSVHGRRVLCVGGIQHAVPRYRARVEGLGGHFEHHDGGLEDSVQTLDGRLKRADVVICQAACINHEAYHRVKRHCDRTGTPCVYLERPSLSRFDRALHNLAALKDAGFAKKKAPQCGALLDGVIEGLSPRPGTPLRASS